MTLDKFNIPFIDFVNQYFDETLHQFVFLQKPQYQHGMTQEHDIAWIDKKYKTFELLQYMYKADKIVIHGLWSGYLIKLLFLQPWLLKKCYWVMWGGDFYFPEKQYWIKKQVIKNIGHFITYIKGDYELVQKWYGAKGSYHECFMYPSNLYKEYDIKPKEHSIINIQLGNSADPTNNHIEVLQNLVSYKDENIKIFTPLSYGDIAYAKEVIAKGKELFGEKFIPLTEFIPFENYLEFLSEIDIAIFAHKRQQAMGNTITLLGLGKKVYMRSDITPWQFFKGINIKVFYAQNLEINLIDEQTQKENQRKIKEYFSKEKLKKQLQEIFS
jgi:hypothetical protein